MAQAAGDQDDESDCLPIKRRTGLK